MAPVHDVVGKPLTDAHSVTLVVNSVEHTLQVDDSTTKPGRVTAQRQTHQQGPSRVSSAHRTGMRARIGLLEQSRQELAVRASMTRARHVECQRSLNRRCVPAVTR
jgi:hypothetical protein